MHRLQISAGDKGEAGVSVLIRRGNFIYNTRCWQGVSSSASILQGWSARLRMYCTVFGNQDCSGTINTRLKQQTLSFFFFVLFFLHFLTKWYKQQYKIFVLLTFYKKKSFDLITVQLFFLLFSPPFEIMWVWYTRIPSGLQPRSCGLRHILKCCMITVIELICPL